MPVIADICSVAIGRGARVGEVDGDGIAIGGPKNSSVLLDGVAALARGALSLCLSISSC